MTKIVAGLFVLFAFFPLGRADEGRLTVHLDKPGFKVSPMFYGLMTEEINHAYDGGLYGELLQNGSLNQSLQDPVHWSAWSQDRVQGPMVLDSDNAVPGTALKRSMRIEPRDGTVGVSNDGYWGIPVRPHTRYTASFYAKTAGQDSVWVEIRGASDPHPILAHSAQVNVKGDWHKYTIRFEAGDSAPSEANALVIWVTGKDPVWVSGVSLFGPTYHNRANGNRPDLMEKMAGMEPSFLRLPGGNYLEGNTIPERFEWKNTIGDVAGREGHQCPWGYRSSDGLGLLEYLGWCEDLKMQPVLAIYAGYSLRQQHVDPGPALEPYVQDALDEIEYVTGSAATKWGAERAKDGHARPFPLTYIEVGNEDNFDRSGSYDGRFTQFYDAIKAKYPSLQMIATAPVHSRKPDVIDDHYYRTARSMARDAHHYDTYDRSAPKIFVGEWASTEGRPTPTYKAALGDAAWLTGLEADSDVVVMEAYAPLFVNVNPRAAQWPTNLIAYDALNSFGSPSYYVQSMFAKNTGDVELPVDVAMNPTATVAETPHGKIGVGTFNTQAAFRNVRVSSGDATLYAKDFAAGSSDWQTGTGTWLAADGVLRQTGTQRDTRATAGDFSWTDYKYHVEARKLSGREGFLVAFHIQEPKGNFAWNTENLWRWNVGGWGDTRTAIQRCQDSDWQEVGTSAPVTIETGRWYSVDIDVHGGDIQCYLDGKLVSEAKEAPAEMLNVFASASRDSKRGVVYLKIVNFGDSAANLTVDLPGVGSVSARADGWQMTGQGDDVNSLAEPEKVVPKAVAFTGLAKTFTKEFPAHSVTVIRLQAR